MDLACCTKKENEFINELLKQPWWKTIKDDKDFRIDLRRMAVREDKDDYPQINVYYGPASFMRIYYTKRHGFKAKIHCKYMDSTLKDSKYVSIEIKKINIRNMKKLAEKNIKIAYGTAKERHFEMNYSKNSENNILITEYTGENETKQEMEKGTKNNIRIDMVRVNKDGKVQFIELKLSNNKELYKKGKEDKEDNPRDIEHQALNYRNYYDNYKDRLSKGMEKHFLMCQALGLNYAKTEPKEICQDITVMIANTKDCKWKKDKFLLNKECEAGNIQVEELEYDSV